MAASEEWVPPTAETLARWWVLLNMWVWPADLPDKPNPPGGLSEAELRYAIRGAHAVIEQIADPALVDALWRDRRARAALLEQEEDR